jgi:WD40 repeat protein
VRSVSWSSDARLLITASDDKTCKVWGSSGARFWCSLVGHTNWVRSAVLSRDTRLAASGSDDKTVKASIQRCPFGSSSALASGTSKLTMLVVIVRPSSLASL